MSDKLGDLIRLKHILMAIEDIENYTKGVELDDFSANSMMFNASLRQLEIIGEASNRLSESFIKNNSDIPWARIVGLRNLLIHQYFGVDDIAIWNIIQGNLPELKQKLLIIISKLEKNS